LPLGVCFVIIKISKFYYSYKGEQIYERPLGIKKK